MSRLSEYLDSQPDSTHGSNCFARILKTKVKHFDGREWYGWLTPKEVIYVVDCWKCEAKTPAHVTWARECLKRGESTPRHFYFNVVDPVKLKLKI